MKKKTIYIIGVLLVCISCTNLQEISLSDEKIQVTVSNALQSDSRTTLFDNATAIVQEENFALSAFIGNTPYIKGAWVNYFNGDWRFRKGGDLLDYYWPNNDNSALDFIAYVPYDLSKFSGNITNIKNADGKMNFTCSLPATIDVSDKTKLDAENKKCEFIYAYRKGQSKSDTPVNLCFVHPFACVKFKLKQGHRNLIINHITLTGIKLSGTYANEVDTQTYKEGQSGLTYEKWETSTSSNDLILSIGKDVPNGVNYGGIIGIPFMVIPQTLENMKLKVNYSWSDTNNLYTAEFPLSTNDVNAWNPGKIYTYTLDLGDNKEEILFNVQVEEWQKGEDEDYENGYEVK